MQAAVVASHDGFEDVLAHLVEPAALVPRLLALEELRAHDRRESKRHEGRHDDRHGDGDGEFAEQAANDAAHEQQRDEHRDQEKVIEMMVKPIWPAPLSAALNGVSPSSM